MRRKLFVCAGLALALGLPWLVHTLTGPRTSGGGALPGAPAVAADEGPSTAGDGLIAPPVADVRKAASQSGVRVRVLDGDRQPVAGALVRVLDGAPLSVNSDAQGRCTLALARRRTLELEVSAAEHVGMRDTFAWQDELELELPRCVVLSGHVLTAEEKRPVAGARVHIARDSRWRPLIDGVVSDASGAFRFECAPLTADLDVCASAAGFPEHDTWVHSGRRAAYDEAEILLDAGPSLTVEVRESADGSPIACARVNDACTDAGGLVEVGREEEGAELMLEADGFCTINGALTSTQLPAHGPLTLLLPRLACFEGFVHDQSGNPVAGAELRFTARDADSANTFLPPLARGLRYDADSVATAKSDADGRYRSTPLLPGAQLFGVHGVQRPAGDCFTTAGPLGPPGTSTRFDVTLAPRTTGTIEGLARFNGEWTEGEVSWSAGPRNGKVPLDVEANYQLTNVEAGAVALSFRGGPKNLRALLADTQALVTVEAGGVTRHDFELTLPMADIAGRVTFADGSPAERVPFSISHEEPDYGGDHRTGRDGYWSQSVPDLGWDLALDFRWGEELVHVDGVRAHDAHVDVVLPGLVYLGVDALDDASGDALADWQLAWRRHGAGPFHPVTRAERGNPIVLAVLPGVVDLYIQESERGYTPVLLEDVRLEAGAENPPLTVRLRRGLELELRMEGDPLAFEEDLLFLVESAAWDDLRLVGSAADARDPAQVGTLLVDGGSALTSADIGRRLLTFDALGRTQLSGLAPGRWRFKALPDHVLFEPESVTLPCERPLVVRCTRKD